MKRTLLRSLTLCSVALTMGLSAAAQQMPKEKFGHHEYKLKSNGAKVKLQKDEDKYKSASLKVKENSNERKVKGWVKPMRITKTEQTMIKEGETRVWTSEPQAPPVVTGQASVVKTRNVKRGASHRYASRTMSHKRIAARKTNTSHRYASRTRKARSDVHQVVKREIVVQPQYIHDTVFVARVDTVVKIERMNTYSGYRVPRGDFKKVKLKRDKDGRVWMKRKE